MHELTLLFGVAEQVEKVQPKKTRKPREKKAEEYRDVISYLRKGYSIRITAKLTSKGLSTVQRVKREFEKEISQ